MVSQRIYHFYEIMYKNVVVEEDSSNMGGYVFSLAITAVSVCLVVVTFPFSMLVAIKQVPVSKWGCKSDSTAAATDTTTNKNKQDQQ